VNEGNREILYEARVAQSGRVFFWAFAPLSVAFITVCIFFLLRRLNSCTDTQLADRYLPAGICGLLAGLFSCAAIWSLRLCLNPGVYRISIDAQGLYVHSDAPDLAPSFTVATADIHRLVQKAIRQSEGEDKIEYYVETKAGTRHQIGRHFDTLDFDGMKVCDKITDHFYWVGVCIEKDRRQSDSRHRIF
jgi:hypothetical protein